MLVYQRVSTVQCEASRPAERWRARPSCLNHRQDCTDEALVDKWQGSTESSNESLLNGTPRIHQPGINIQL